MLYIVLIILGILVCAAILPVAQYIYFNFCNKKEEIIYEFPKELIDAEFPDSNFFKMNQEKFEKKRQQVFSKELP